MDQERDRNSPTIEETGVSPSALALALAVSVNSNSHYNAHNRNSLSPPATIAASDSPPSLYPSANWPSHRRASSSSNLSSSSVPSTGRQIHPKLKTFKLGDAPVPPSLLLRRWKGKGPLPTLSSSNLPTRPGLPQQAGSYPPPFQIARAPPMPAPISVERDGIGALLSPETTPVLRQAHALFAASDVDVDLVNDN